MTEPLYDVYGDLPKVPGMQHPSFEEYEAGLLGWQKARPERITIEERGRTVEGRPIYMARVTDRTVADDDKQVLLLSASHGESEISSVCGILHFLKWLLSDDCVAERLRRGLVVITIPLLEADTYVSNREKGGMVYGNKKGRLIYHLNAWTWDGPPPEADHPEQQTFFEMMEECQPDAHFDLHGLPWRDLGMVENVDIATPRLGRCFDPAIPEEVSRAVDAAGYCAIRSEVQAGRRCVARNASELGTASHHFACMPDSLASFGMMINPTLMSFHRYHSVSFVAELFWMGSMVAACRRLAELGVERAPSEFFPGYRNNLVDASTHLLVSAWGDTAARRRKSRVELWNRSGLCLQNGAPMVLSDTMLASCATTPEGQRLLGVDPETGNGEGREKFLENIKNDKRFNAAALRDFLGDFPPTMFAYSSAVNYPKPGGADYSPIRNGLALRVCLQYADASVKEVRHNGHLLAESPTDGYMVHHRQGTAVQVNIPPQKVHDLHVVTIRYDAPKRPLQGFTADDWSSDAPRVPAG